MSTRKPKKTGNTTALDFGSRLRTAFGGKINIKIADELGVSEVAVGNYIADRVPTLPLLLKISELTNCSVHWLLTGEGNQFIDNSGMTSFDEMLDKRIKYLLDIELSNRKIGRPSLPITVKDVVLDKEAA
jgi:transcriptional regulator with XRE-family HTH domain